MSTSSPNVGSRVGETPGSEPVKNYAPYSVPANKELQMIFQFHQWVKTA